MKDGIFDVMRGIDEMMRGIDFDSEIKFAPEGTTEADLFGVYEDEVEDEVEENVSAMTDEQIEELKNMVIDFDELY